MLLWLLACKDAAPDRVGPDSARLDSLDSAAPAALEPMPCEDPQPAWGLAPMEGAWALPDTRDARAGRTIHNPVALADFTGDGRDELVIGARGQGVFFYTNTPGGWSGGVLAADLDPSALAVGDLDGDADLDLLAAGDGTELRQWRNEGGVLVEVTPLLGLDALELRKDVRDLSLGDLDGDGDLDLFITVSATAPPEAPASERHRLLLNEGDGRFLDVSAWLDPAQLEGLGWVTVFTDIDQDGDPDLYTVTAEQAQFGPSRLLRSDGPTEGGWAFTELTDTCGCAWTNSAMGVAVGDTNGDGWQDLFITSTGAALLLQAAGDGGYVDVAAAAGAQVVTAPNAMSWGAAVRDLNNDGWLDLLASTGRLFQDVDNLGQPEGQRDVLLLGDGASFVDVAPTLGLDDPGDGRGVASGLVNGDLSLDLVVVNVGDAPSTGWFGQCTAEDRALVVELQGAGANTFGVGAQVEVQTAERTLVHEVSAEAGWGGAVHPRAVFGLGALQTERLRVRWPSGAVSVVELPPDAAGRLVVGEEP